MKTDEKKIIKNITMIAAIGKNYELGFQNSMIWSIPEDLHFFREATMHKQIVMGLKTFDALPGILPGRRHIVLTHRNLDLGPEVLVFHDFQNLLNYLQNQQEEIMIIGGGQIYKQFLPYAYKMILTEINDSKPADTYFPQFAKEEWNSTTILENDSNDPTYKRLIYVRK